MPLGEACNRVIGQLREPHFLPWGEREFVFLQLLDGKTEELPPGPSCRPKADASPLTGENCHHHAPTISLYLVSVHHHKMPLMRVKLFRMFVKARVNWKNLQLGPPFLETQSDL